MYAVDWETLRTNHQEIIFTVKLFLSIKLALTYYTIMFTWCYVFIPQPLWQQNWSPRRCLFSESPESVPKPHTSQV